MRVLPAKRLGHLPLMMDVLRRTKALEIIDHACGQHKLSDVSTGECVAVLLAGVYVGAHSLWRIRERLEPYDMNTVMQDATFSIEKFPEERLAKALDDLFQADLDKIMTSLAIRTIDSFDLQTDFLHFDTTSLSFYGSYERENFGSIGDGQPPPRVTYGHSKANRPDLKQVLFGCLSTGDGGVPLLGKVLDGNMSDNVAAAEFFSRVRELVADPRKVCLVADCKGWCSRTLQTVQQHQLRLLSRMPRTVSLHKTLMEKSWNPDEIIERPTKRIDTDGTEIVDRYEIMGFDVDYPYQVQEKHTDGSTKVVTQMIQARAVRVFSTSLLRRKMKTLERIRKKETGETKKKIRDWQDIAYVCQSDAERSANRNCTQHDAVTHNLKSVVAYCDGPVKKGRGRPRKRPEPILETKEHWRVTYQIVPVDEKTSKNRLHDQATFILIRTRNNDWSITDKEMIERYRDQYHVEHGFAWLKSQADINPMFIHSPRRIAAMGLVYCLGLIIWNLIQRTVRKHLTTTGTGLPYHRNKPSANITTRFLFELFPQVQTIVLIDDSGHQEKRTLGLEEWQIKAAEALGTSLGAFKPVVDW